MKFLAHVAGMGLFAVAVTVLLFAVMAAAAEQDAKQAERSRKSCVVELLPGEGCQVAITCDRAQTFAPTHLACAGREP